MLGSRVWIFPGLEVEVGVSLIVMFGHRHKSQKSRGVDISKSILFLGHGRPCKGSASFSFLAQACYLQRHQLVILINAMFETFLELFPFFAFMRYAELS